MKKKFLSIVLALSMLCALFPAIPASASTTASGTCGSNLTWMLDSSGALTISGTGAMWDWEGWTIVPWQEYANKITSVLIGDGVTYIGNYSFVNMNYIIKMTLGNSITRIGVSAISSCNHIEEINIPSSVTIIEDSNFDSGNFEYIFIPYNVSSIGAGTFTGSNLTTIEVDSRNSYYSSESGVLFNKDKTQLITCPRGKSGTYYIPYGVTEIKGSAFSWCRELNEIIIPTTTTIIGDAAFNYCDSINEMVIPDSVTNIGRRVFENCKNLNSISIPSSVTSIGQLAFYQCTNLSNINIPNSVTSIGNQAFMQCDSLQNVIVPNSITAISYGMFEACANLKSVTIPNSITTIGQLAFQYSENFTDVYYIGRSSQWSNISIGSSNDPLNNATKHYLLDDTIFTSSTRSTDSYTTTYGGEYHYWEFTPSVGGTYVFESTLSSGDTYGYLYDSSFNQLKYNDDGGDGNNFLITFDATAGETYYLGARWYSSSTTGNIPVKLSRRYTISYNANGGTGAPSAQYKKYGDSLTLSSTTPTREGCTFLGWSTSSTATSASYQPGGTFSTNGNYTLYAVWDVPTYTITYNSGISCSNLPSNQTVLHGNNLTVSNTIPVSFPNTLAYWEDSVTGEYYYPGDTISGINSSRTLRAWWTSNSTFTDSHASSGDASIIIAGTYRYFRFTPEETGDYVFYTTGSDDTYGYLYDEDGNEITHDDDGGDGSNCKITYNLTAGTTYYYGVRYYNTSKTGTINVNLKRQYTILYNANGGSGAPSSQTKLHGDTVTLSDTVPVRDGYSFVGWSSWSVADAAEYAAGSSYSDNGNITLYAVWSPLQTVSAPTVNVSYVEGGKAFNILCETEGAVIHYTTDGSTPTASSPTIEKNGGLAYRDEGTYTVKAIGVKDGYNNSAVASVTFTVSKTDAPTASVPSGSVDYGSKLTLSSNISDSTPTIYYTTDGSAPTTSSAQYTEEIEINPPMTVKAITVANGYITSDTAEFTYTMPQAAAPAISENAVLGGKAVTLSSTLDGAEIYYTTNGSAPTINSARYTDPIMVTSEGDTVIKAIAVKGGYINSEVSALTVSIEKTTAPAASPASGEVPKGTSVELSCAADGAIIYYTTDGSAPTTSSAIYDAPISLDSSATIKAMAVGIGCVASDKVEFTYTVPTASTPVISVSDAEGGKSVEITSSTDGAEIYYTTNGAEPTHSSALYTGQFTLDTAGTYTIKAIAVKEELVDSAATEATITVGKASAPTASIESGTVVDENMQVSLSSDTAGAEIHYSTDGSEPTKSSALYTAPITITESLNIKAIAICGGYVNSDVVSLNYTVSGETAAVSINISNIIGGKSITLSCATPNAHIYYTLDSTTPTESSAEYTEPISVTTAGMKLIKAIAISDGNDPSAVTSDTLIAEKLSAPNASPSSGRVPKGTMLSLSASGGAADVYYTIDGTEPTSASERYTSPIELAESVTIKAAAIGMGYVASDAVEFSYTVYEKCASPIITVTENQGVKTAEISCATDGAEIYYTTDGSNPTSSSARYNGAVVFDAPTECVIKAIAVKSGYEDSEIASKAVTVTKTQPPTASVESGTVQKGTEIELEGNGVIYYTVNGGEEQIYTQPIVIDDDTVIRAYAMASGSLKSDTAEYTYEIERITSGTEGSITWNFANGILTVTGTGAIPDYETEQAPWYPLKKMINKIVVEQRIDTIGTNAFYGLDKVTEVSLASTVSQINAGAFEGCTALKSITLPSEMNRGIGTGAFKNTSLTSITIPSGVNVIGSGVFEGCENITEITLPFIGSQVGSRNNTDTFSYIFGGNVPSSLKKVTITNETDVPENAFKDLTHIETIIINNSVKTIGNGAFDGCASLKEFTVPSGIKAIGDNTFRGCESAVTITVPNSVTAIGEAAFDGCKKLKEINIPSGVTVINDYTFRGCESLTKIDIPMTVTNIGVSVLEGCKKLYSVKVPFVGVNADPDATDDENDGLFGYFFGCANGSIPAAVTKVEITSTNKAGYIPREAFKDCAYIEDIMIDGGRSILDNAFENCKNLKHLYIPKSISNIGNTILVGCTSLETLVIPFIGKNRSDSGAETSVLGGFFGWDDDNIAKGTAQYYDGEHYHYYSIPNTLKNVSILNQTTIPTGAFSECDFIETAAIITGAVMNEKAFYHCTSLKTITLPNDLQTINSMAFAECESLETINIPTKVKTIGEQAFYNCRSLKNVTMPDSVTEIADDVFNGTNLLSTVNLFASGGVITCSEGSAAYNYAVEKGIQTNVVPSEELNIRKASVTVALLSDGVYLFDITDSYNMRGVLHTELYDADNKMLTERTQTANDVEYRIEFYEEEMTDVSYAKIYITGEDGTAVSTETETVYLYGEDITEPSESPKASEEPTPSESPEPSNTPGSSGQPDSNAAIEYNDGVVTFTGTSLKAGSVLLQAIYNDDNTLNRVNIYPVFGIDDEIEVDTDFEVGTAKFMLWESLKGIKPIADCIEK